MTKKDKEVQDPFLTPPEAITLAEDRRLAKIFWEMEKRMAYQEGFAEGLAATRQKYRERILEECESLEIELTPERIEYLDEPNTNRAALFASLANERHWPSFDHAELKNLSADREARRIAKDRELADIAWRNRKGSTYRQGRDETYRKRIRQLCESFEIELTPERGRYIDDLGTDLDELFASVLRERAWPHL